MKVNVRAPFQRVIEAIGDEMDVSIFFGEIASQREVRVILPAGTNEIARHEDERRLFHRSTVNEPRSD